MATVLELNPIPDTQDTPETKPEPPANNVVDIVKKGIESGADASVLTGLYLKLRSAKQDLEEQAKGKIGPLTEGLKLIENHFLKLMLDMGVDSLKNEAGNPYKTEKVSITVADNEAFLDFVLTSAMAGLPLNHEAVEKIKTTMIESGQLSLIEARASKLACEAYMENTGELPPGLNRSSVFAVNVRAG